MPVLSAEWYASVDIEELQEIQRDLERQAEAMHGPQLVQAMKDAVLYVLGKTKSRGFVPVDTGRLRASLTPEIVWGPTEIQGIVGTTVKYGPPQEFGFTTRGGGHYPGKRYMQRALAASKTFIRNRIDKWAASVIGPQGAH